jgi:hypothetical protein
MSRRAELGKQARSCRASLDEAKQYRDAIRSVVETMGSHLAAGRPDAAARTIERAASESKAPDPVLESLAAYVERRRAEARPWDDRDAADAAAMIERCLDWKAARQKHLIERYEAFLRRYPDGPFAEEAMARLVDIEVAAIFTGAPGKLPAAERKAAAPGQRYATVRIENDTSYNLTIRYSGRESFKVVYAPKEKAAVELLVGDYLVAASVDAANVRDYAGKDEFHGGDYDVTFYIQDSLTPTLRFPAYTFALGGSRGSETWPLKRQIPEYLKHPAKGDPARRAGSEPARPR